MGRQSTARVRATLRMGAAALLTALVPTAASVVEGEGGSWAHCLVTERDDAGAPREVSCGEVVLRRPSSVGEAEAELSVGQRLVCIIGASLCVLCAAFAAGLTLGLVSLDEFGLRVLCNRDIRSEAGAGKPEAADARLLRDQSCARRILPIVSGRFFGEGTRPRGLNPTNGHLLLVTMLLLNSVANEALPLFLDRLVPPWAAICISVTVVLLFGEIFPSAIFTGPHQLQLAAALCPVVAAVRMLLFPIAGPISVLLDLLVGSHGHDDKDDRREEMKAMAKTLLLQGLERDEVDMITGVLEMHAKTALHISKPLEDAKMLAHDEVLTEETAQALIEYGHSRVFVYRRDEDEPSRRDDIVGVLLVKKLLGIDLHEGRRIDSVTDALKSPVVLRPEDNLLCVLDKFQAGMCHLAVVMADTQMPGENAVCDADETERPTMFCSLEDVIEALLKEDIFDEADLELGRATAGVSCATPGSLPKLLNMGFRCRSPTCGAEPPSVRASRLQGLWKVAVAPEVASSPAVPEACEVV